MIPFDDSSGYPDQLSGRVIVGRLAWATLFSVTEVWAVLVVLTQIRVAGVQAAALAFVVAGVVLVTWSEWQEMRSLLRRYNNRLLGAAPDARTS
ncbi:MAG: hypothetical protein ACRDTT_33610 [Pseudonocardiaceae bacterium]